MLFLEASNPKDQSTLHSLFDSQRNLFSVPFKQTHHLQHILEMLHLQCFNVSTYSKNLSPDRRYPNLLGSKILQLLKNFLKMHISLDEIRQVFKLIQQTEEEIIQYRGYVQKLSSILEDQEERENGQAVEHQDGNWDNWKVLEEDNKYITTLYNEIVGIQTQNELKPMKYQIKTPNSRELEPEFKSRPLNAQITNFQPEDYCRTRQTKELSDSENQLAYVEEQPYCDKKTVSTFYCPEWKIIENQKNKHMNDILVKDKQLENNQVDQSGFVENLSKIVNPVPSALVNDSITSILKKEEKDDKKKLNFFRNSMKCMEKDNNCQQNAYEQNIRMIKLQKKLNMKKCKAKKPSKTEVKKQEEANTKGKGVLTAFSKYFKG